MDVRQVIQKQLDAWQYDFAITNKLVGRDPAGESSKFCILPTNTREDHHQKIKENGIVSFYE